MKRFLVVLGTMSALIILPIILISGALFLNKLNTIEIQPRKKLPKDWDVKKIVMRYAPVFFQEIDAENKRQSWDHICAFDFDGDWDATNNAENVQQQQQQKLHAGVYYSYIETKTHFIINYSVFHPLEWSYEEQKLDKWYENDMKHLQVIVRKKKKHSMDGTVSLVAIQKREKLAFYKSKTCLFRTKKHAFMEAPIILANEQGKLDPAGTHPVIVISSGRHNLYLPQEKHEAFSSLDKLEFKQGIQYIPSLLAKGEIADITETQQQVRYALLDTFEHLWDPLNTKERKAIFQLNFSYKDKMVSFKDVPLYFRGDQQQSKSTLANPNITPFAFGKPQGKKHKFSFFFNPVAAYLQFFSVKEKWSMRYWHYPYFSPEK